MHYFKVGGIVVVSPQGKLADPEFLILVNSTSTIESCGWDATGVFFALGTCNTINKQLSSQYQMVSKPSLNILDSSPFICPSCIRSMRLQCSSAQKRFITQNYLRKTLEAKLQWTRQATEIRAGKKERMLDMLEKRGFINQIVGSRDDLDMLLTEKRIGIYCGVDPTAPSMHVGHLLPLMVLYWFYIKGFHTCSLVHRQTFPDTMQLLLLTLRSLEGLLHRSETHLGERPAEKSSMRQYEK